MADTAMPPIEYELDAARERVSLTVGGERFAMSAGELERLVQFLGMVRSAMKPAVEPEVPQTPFLQIEAPQLAVRVTKDEAWAGLIVRTEPYGWIGLHLDRTRTGELGRHLAELATRMKAGASG